MINDKLSYRDRCLRTLTGKLLLGPTGKRLFVDYLDKVPGFSGRIDFIHTINITSLFEVKCSVQRDFEAANTTWYPSLLTMELENHRISFSETKFITLDDCAVSLQRWQNKSSKPIELSLVVQAELCEAGIDAKTGCYTLQTPETVHGYAVGVGVCTNIGLEKAPLVLEPNASVEFVVVAATGNLETESMTSIIKKAQDFFADEVDYVARHNQEYEQFFRGIPKFNSSDPVLNQTWYYRWFIMRHNLAQPDYGFLQGIVMYEGRSHKKTKRPLDSSGWGFAKLINLSTPLHITDMRWHSDRKYVRDMIKNMVANLEENGLFCSAYVDRQLHSFANYGVWAIYQFYQVDGNDQVITDVLPQLKAVVDNETRVYSEDDNLQIEVKHNRTGKEYQPSYWYFHDYPQNPKDMTTYTPLKRVDRSIYHYLNVLGLAKMCQAVDDSDADKYFEFAAEIKADVINKMWDEDSEFFYDLHHKTDEKAMVKNIVGVYPYWAEITDSIHLGGLEKLFDPQHFNTKSPFPSVSKECPAYRPEGGWMGRFIKGRNGCVWCGPSWPYTTAVAIDAIAKESRKHNHQLDQEFAYYLREYSLQHFRDRDLKKPYLVEHYHGETGEPLSDEVDYNHSYYLDLIMTHVAGIQFTDEGIKFDPIDVDLDYFIFEDILIQGNNYTISYKKADCDTPEANQIPVGYTVLKNGVKLELD